MHLNGFAARSLVGMGMLLMMMKQVSAPRPMPRMLLGPAVPRGRGFATTAELVPHTQECQSTRALSEYEVISRFDPCRACPNVVEDRYMMIICKHCLGAAPVQNPLCDDCYEVINSVRLIIKGYSEHGNAFLNLAQAFTSPRP
ncbi:hypothetical protein PGT21_005441 [Puccinia graminis f. sp. tritici]|uniref:Uncharacterized protein n=1 Tax=Puccinia graminis f. sp. tritici TaxID=56615 RepID=A0A5B0NBN7_PUCGR|nr:hypothetical protein PGT21_005441 [Puccinia graminis f. sp. tritici]KAA1129935.1 hypothetical protein PGTUg99_006898 [Puccinia graminis f. sp. tritici]